VHDEQIWASGHADEIIRQVSQAKTADAYNLLCRVYYALESWDEAIKNCERAVELSPSVAQYHLWLGRAYGSKAEHAGAFAAFSLARKTVASFERALQLDPKDIRIRRDLAEYYANAPSIVGGGKDKARRLADDIASSDPVNAAFIRGMTATEDKNTAEAEKQFKAAVQSSGGSAEALLRLAHFYKRQQRWNEFDATINSAVSATKKSPEDLFETGELLVGSHRNADLAVQSLNQYLAGARSEYGPAFRAHYLVGQALETKGDRAKAIEEYKAALSLASGYKRAQLALKNLGA
jgi:tetratricopeptide (TPR) repeat protein